MSETPSNMLALGTKAPDFKLLNPATGEKQSLTELKSDVATVIMFICNHCPYVKHIQSKLIEVSNNYKNKKINFIAINANDAKTYPVDAPDKMAIEAKKYSFPYLYDEDQRVAKAYHAACTPDFFIFDKDLACVYRGRFDAATPGNQIPVTGKDLTNALDNILKGDIPDPNQKPSLGCNIKWKKI